MELCMASGRATGTDLIEVLDRVLDKGIVVDAGLSFLSWAWTYLLLRAGSGCLARNLPEV